jgi:hypothetical protein
MRTDRSPKSVALILVIVLAGFVMALVFQPVATRTALAQSAIAPPDDEPWHTQQAQLLASDGVANDNFGGGGSAVETAVALSGNTAIVGAWRAPNQNDRGGAYVYVRSGTTWSQQQMLLPADAANSYRIGYSVAIDGETAVVSAPRHTVGSKLNQGVVYIFVRSGTTWTQQQQFTSSDGAQSDEFGSAVAIKGDTVLVGAWNNNSSRGATYVFTRSGTTWTQQQKLTASDIVVGDQFGAAVALTADTAVIGSRQDLGCGTCTVGPGAAYVFARSGSTWPQQQKLTAGDGANGDAFASAVAIDRDTIAVGAYRNDESPTVPDRGAVYVFVRSGATWSLQQKLRGSNGNTLPSGNGGDNLFGQAVAVGGNTIVAGATGWTQSPDNHRGKVFVFDRSGTAWTEVEGFQPPNTVLNTDFGAGVAISGDAFVASAPGDTIGSNSAQGDAFVYATGLNLSIADTSLPEGNVGITMANFTVTLSGPATHPVVVDYATSNGTATAGVDYGGIIQILGTLTFAPGETSKTISVPINGDTVFEPDETFFVTLSNPDNANIARAQATGTIINDDLPPTFQFSSSGYSVNESDGFATVTITRTGDASVAASVDYATSDGAGTQGCSVINGKASSKCDYLTAIGTLKFAAGETAKTVLIQIIDDAYAEGPETFNVSLSNPLSPAVLGSVTTATVTINDNDSTNGVDPIDDANFFVHQHYIDFLNRQPDPAGLNFWDGTITSCGSDQQCIAVKRVNASGAFFISIEFQNTGYLVYRIYKSAYGNLSGAPVPIRLNEFLPDTQEIGQGVIVNQGNWQQQLENNKQAFTLEFVQRSRFTAAFPTSLTPAQFVDAMFANGGVTPSTADRNAAINEFSGAGNSTDVSARSRALRDVAENTTLNTQEFNRAFVLMQYFGYLRRNPNDAPDSDFSGYNFWLNKLNSFANYTDAEMVKAFILSSEYRQRFGP